MVPQFFLVMFLGVLPDDKIKRREAEAAVEARELLDAAKELRESIAKYQELLAHGVDEQGEEARRESRPWNSLILE